MSGVVRNSDNEDGSKELYFEVPWGVIRAKAWGEPNHFPILMVHGLQDNAGSFDRLIPLLPNVYYYVCIDLPGHGKSTAFPSGIFLNLMLYVSAVRRVICQLKWTEFYIIAHSLGGHIGSYYTALYPEQVKKLVLFDSLTQLTVSFDGYLRFYKENIKQLMELEEKMKNRSPPNYTYEEALYRLIYHRPYPINQDAGEALIKRSLKETQSNRYCFSADQRLKFGVRAPMVIEQHLAIFSKINCPVLLLITNLHLMYIEQFQKNNYESQTLELIKSKSNFLVISVEGHHDVHNNQPELVAVHVNKFLKQQKSSL